MRLILEVWRYYSVKWVLKIIVLKLLPLSTYAKFEGSDLKNNFRDARNAKVPFGAILYIFDMLQCP